MASSENFMTYLASVTTTSLFFNCVCVSRRRGTHSKGRKSCMNKRIFLVVEIRINLTPAHTSNFPGAVRHHIRLVNLLIGAQSTPGGRRSLLSKPPHHNNCLSSCCTQTGRVFFTSLHPSCSDSLQIASDSPPDCLWLCCHWMLWLWWPVIAGVH